MLNLAYINYATGDNGPRICSLSLAVFRPNTCCNKKDLSFNPIPTGCCHVTLIYGLIPPMAGRNRVKLCKISVEEAQELAKA